MALLPNTTTSNVPTDVVAVPAALVDAIQDNMETTFGAYLVCTCLGCM